jgi:hypothetical protein
MEVEMEAEPISSSETDEEEEPSSPPSFSAGFSVQQLKHIITEAGLSFAGITEKHELEQLAAEALESQGAPSTPGRPTKPMGTSSPEKSYRRAPHHDTIQDVVTVTVWTMEMDLQGGVRLAALMCGTAILVCGAIGGTQT